MLAYSTPVDSGDIPGQAQTASKELISFLVFWAPVKANIIVRLSFVSYQQMYFLSFSFDLCLSVRGFSGHLRRTQSIWTPTQSTPYAGLAGYIIWTDVFYHKHALGKDGKRLFDIEIHQVQTPKKEVLVGN